MNIRLSAQALGTFALPLAATAANADSDLPRMAIANPAYVSECGSCHIAFPPALLSAASWRAVMGNLQHHFDSDASLDPATTADITRFLLANAGRRDTADTAGKPLLRITDTGWFRREHRDGHDGITTGIFRSTAVKSPANCSACHRNAAEGSYNERDIRIPGQGGQS